MTNVYATETQSGLRRPHNTPMAGKRVIHYGGSIMDMPLEVSPALYRWIQRGEVAVITGDRRTLDRVVRKLRGLRFSISTRGDNADAAAVAAAMLMLHRQAPGDLDKALTICGVRLSALRDRPVVLAWLQALRGDLHLARYAAHRSGQDLDWAVEAWRESLGHTAADDPDRAERAAGLAWSLIVRYRVRQDPTDLAAAAEQCRAYPELGEPYLDALQATAIGAPRPGVALS